MIECYRIVVTLLVSPYDIYASLFTFYIQQSEKNNNSKQGLATETSMCS